MAQVKRPFTGSNAKYPAGFATIVASMDVKGLQEQRSNLEQGQSSYFCSNKQSSGSQYDIEQGDIVFQVRPHIGKNRSYRTKVRKGEPVVRSALNGLNSICDGENLMDVKEELNLSDAFFLDWVLSRLKIIGVANNEFRLNRDGERQQGGFAVRIAGITTFKIRHFMPIGSLVRVKIPSKQEFNSIQYENPDGHDPSAIKLQLVPVERYEITQFGMRLMYEYVHRNGREALEKSRALRRVSAMRNFACANKEYALTVGILFAVQLLKHGILQVARAPAQAWNMADARRDTGRVPGVMLDGQANAISNVYTPQSAGTIFYYAPTGNGGTMNSPPPDGTAQNDIRACAYPEEVGVILGKLTGLLEPPNVFSSLPGTANGEKFHRALHQADQVGTAREYQQERIQITKMVSDFQRQVFVASGCAHAAEARMVAENYEFGNFLNYPLLQEIYGGHLARTPARQTNMVRNVQSSTLYGKMLSAQLNAWSCTLNSFENLLNVQRSFYIGRVTEHSTDGKAADVLLAEGIS